MTTPVEVLEHAAALLIGGGYNPTPETLAARGRTVYEAVCVAAGLPSGPEIRATLDVLSEIPSSAITFGAIEAAQLSLGYVCDVLGIPALPGEEQAVIDAAARPAVLRKPLGIEWALGVIRRAQANAAKGLTYRYWRHGLADFPGIH